MHFSFIVDAAQKTFSYQAKTIIYLFILVFYFHVALCLHFKINFGHQKIKLRQ